ncbi:glycosyltransferase [Galbibacter sp. BG1]|uniref:glycosyltransferase n=1 Tax=Galbibacter sp. BG1 TaxID=1170699 RepID=UPI0015C16D99|nr:glycosyltransferase [Galbibacter sp. BG1]QLE00088.1 glycosyltransferase [Galbibacter sp. BG1]
MDLYSVKNKKFNFEVLISTNNHKSIVHKKCVLVCPSKVWGGIEKNVLLRAKELRRRGYEVYVILLNGQFEEKFKNDPEIKVINISSRGGDLNIFVLLNYVKIFREIKPYTVFAALKKDWFLVSLAARLAKVPKTILYLGILREIKDNLKYKFIFKNLKNKVLVNSNSLKNHLLKNTNLFNDSNVVCVYNGFSVPGESDYKIDFKSKLNLKKDTVILGCAGRFSYIKGFDYLPQILSYLPENYHVIHIGKGELEKEIKTLIMESDYRDRIHFLGFFEDVKLFFNSIDIFLLPSRSEGMANVLNEAMSFGKPVVSTKVPGSEELLNNGEYGILTEIGDAKAMAEGIIAISDQTVVFEPNKLKARIEENFSIEKMIDNTEHLFFELN